MKIKVSDLIYESKTVEKIGDAQKLYITIGFMNTKYIDLAKNQCKCDDIIRLLNTNEIWNAYSVLEKYKHERIVIGFINDTLNPLYEKINSCIIKLHEQLNQFHTALQNYDLCSSAYLSPDIDAICGLIDYLDNSHPFSSFARLCSDFILTLVGDDSFKEDMLKYYISLRDMISKLFESMEMEIEDE